MTSPAVSVVIPTRDRPRLLGLCLDAIATSVAESTRRVEVIVVDDGSDPPLRREGPLTSLDLVLLRLGGGGPAAARNAGLLKARGEIVLFTDDDTLPEPGWIEAGANYLAEHIDAVGVEGPVSSPDWDPLFEHSVRVDGPGHYVTANIAYRRDALVSIGGFDEQVFRFAHAEDRDLAARSLELGGIGFADKMVVAHAPRALTMRHVVRRARWARDDIMLFTLHPEMTSGWRLPVRLALVWNATSQWIELLAQGDRRSPRRWRRALAATAVSSIVATWTVLRTPSNGALRRTPPASELAAPTAPRALPPPDAS
jgi:glycosyltransferase involved in cell wall biosynthesis